MREGAARSACASCDCSRATSRSQTLGESTGEVARDSSRSSTFEIPRQALLSALERALAAPRRWAAAAACVLVLAAVLSAFWFGRAQPSGSSTVCRDSASQLESVWNERTRAELQQSFADSPVRYAQATHERVVATLDRYGQGWVAMHQEACEATHVRGEQSHELLDLRMRCLRRRLRSLEATRDIFVAHLDPGLVRRGQKVASQLPAVADCGDLDALAAVVPVPADAGQRQRIDELTSELERARALHAAGRFQDARERVERALAAGTDIDYPPLAAENHHLLGLLQHELNDERAALASQYAAARLAARAGDDRLVARALIEAQREDFYLARREGAAGERALRLGPAVEVALERVVDDPAVIAEHQLLLGEMNYRLDRWDESRPHFARALELRKDAFGARDIRVAQVLRFLVSVYPDERATERMALAEQALAIHQEALGPSHPSVAEMLNVMAHHVPAGSPERAVALYKRTRDIFARAFGPDDWTVGRALNNQGESMCQAGRIADGLATIARGLTIYERSFGATHCHLVYPLVGVGHCHERAGRPALAIAPLERALANCDGEKLHLGHVAVARFALARVLSERSDGERERARALADQARDEFVRMGKAGAGRRARVEAWLAARPSDERVPTGR